MRRAPGPADLPAMLHVMRRIANSKADVVHGHGAKGGAYIRMAPNTKRAVRVYTPHGGSLHYDPRRLAGRLFLGTEKLLIGRGDVYIFESAYSADVFKQKIGKPRDALTGRTQWRQRGRICTGRANDLMRAICCSSVNCGS